MSCPPLILKAAMRVRNVGEYKQWRFRKIWEDMVWHVANNAGIISHNPETDGIAIVLVRFLHDLSEWDTTISNPDGPIVYFDYLYSDDDTAALQALVTGMERWKHHQCIAFMRHGRDTEPRIYPPNFCLRFTKLILRQMRKY